MNDLAIEQQQKQHEDMLQQMRVDTFINGIMATATLLTFITLLVHHTHSKS